MYEDYENDMDMITGGGCPMMTGGGPKKKKKTTKKRAAPKKKSGVTKKRAATKKRSRSGSASATLRKTVSGSKRTTNPTKRRLSCTAYQTKPICTVNSYRYGGKKKSCAWKNKKCGPQSMTKTYKKKKAGPGRKRKVPKLPKSGKKYEMTEGSRRQVWNGTAFRTSGGLTKKDLKFNKDTGRIVSKKVSAMSKKRYQAGKTGLVPKTKEGMAALRKKRSKSRK